MKSAEFPSQKEGDGLVGVIVYVTVSVVVPELDIISFSGPDPKLLNPLKLPEEATVLHVKVLPRMSAVGLKLGELPLHMVVLKGSGVFRIGFGYIVTLTASISLQPLSL